MEKRTSILGGALLLTAANLLMRWISIQFNVYISGQIGAAGLGLLQLISTVGFFAILLGTSGVRVAAMTLAAEEFGHGRPGGVCAAVRIALRLVCILSFLAGAALVLLAKPIAVGLLRDANAALSLRAMGLLLPFGCLCGVMTGYFTAGARIGELVTIEIAERLASVGITVALLRFWAGTDISRACCAITLGSSLGCVFDFALLYARFRRRMRGIAPQSEGIRRRLTHLSVPLALNDYLRAGLNTVEQLLIPFGLSYFAGSTEQAMADYGTIHAMVFPVLMFPAAILYSVSDLLIPELSRSRARGRRRRIIDLTDKCIRMTLLFCAAVSGVMLLGAPQLGELVCRSESAGRYLRVFAPMILMLYLDAIVDGMLKGLTEQLSCVRYNTFTSLLDVILLLLLLPRLGVGGYVLSFALTHGINLWLSLRRLLKVTGHRPRMSDFLRPLGAMLPASAAVALLPLGGGALRALLLRSGAYLLLLAVFALLFGALRVDDCAWLRRVFLRLRRREDETKNDRSAA